MASAAAPDKRVLVLVPVSGGTLDGLLDLDPGVEPSALESQRAQHLPPRLDKVQVGRILRLEHELPAWVGQGEQQHVDAAVDVEVVDHGVDPLGSGLDPGLDVLEEVDPVRGGPALLALPWHFKKASELPYFEHADDDGRCAAARYCRGP